MPEAIIFYVNDWSFRLRGQTLVCRPSWKTLLGRLLLSAFLIGIGGWMVYSHGWPDFSAGTSTPTSPASPEAAELKQQTDQIKNLLRSTMTEEEYKKFEQEQKENRAQRQSQQRTDAQKTNLLMLGIQIGYAGLLGIFAIAGTLSPLSTIWQVVTIRRAPHGGLRFRKTGFIPTSQTTVLQSVTQLSVLNEEYASQTEDGLYQEWRWKVQVYGSDNGTNTLVEFQTLTEKEAPAMVKYLPERVKLFTRATEALTGLECTPPARVQVSHITHGLFVDKSHAKASND
jgi:hypothetical protein